jgi:hypothetical protein
VFSGRRALSSEHFWILFKEREGDVGVHYGPTAGYDPERSRLTFKFGDG